MKSGKLFVACAVISIALVGLSSLTPRAAQAAEKTLKIAVVDLQAAVDQYQMKIDREAELRVVQNAKQEDLERRLKEVEALIEEMKMLDESNPERKKKRWVLAEKKALLDATRDVTTREFQEQLKDAREEIYDDIIEALEEFRQLRGYDLIIRSHLPFLRPDLPRVRIVLVHDKSVDVTEDLISFLNEKYAKRIK